MVRYILSLICVTWRKKFVKPNNIWFFFKWQESFHKSDVFPRFLITFHSRSEIQSKYVIKSMYIFRFRISCHSLRFHVIFSFKKCSLFFHFAGYTTCQWRHCFHLRVCTRPPYHWRSLRQWTSCWPKWCLPHWWFRTSCLPYTECGQPWHSNGHSDCLQRKAHLHQANVVWCLYEPEVNLRIWL